VSLSWASSATCPAQYGVYEYDIYGNATLVGCTKNGVIDVDFQGTAQWVRVWFNTGDDTATVIQYSDAARTYMGEHVNPQFDLDYATWLATQPRPGWDPFGGGH
jgi:hypothetical protein